MEENDDILEFHKKNVVANLDQALALNLIDKDFYDKISKEVKEIDHKGMAEKIRQFLFMETIKRYINDDDMDKLGFYHAIVTILKFEDERILKDHINLIDFLFLPIKKYQQH